MLPDGHDTYRTFIGALLSLLTLMTLLTYGIYKLQRLVTIEDFQVGMHVLENYYPSNAVFGYDDGFLVSAAVTNYDGSS